MSTFVKLQLSLVLFAVLAGNASAIVVSGKEWVVDWPEEPHIHAEMPFRTPVDIGHNNVGKKGNGGSTGVYLGNGWVLTAKHVGADDITLNGTTYQYDGENVRLIENPTGIEGLVSVHSDLRLYHLSEEPDLPAIQIAMAPPAIGTTIYYAGYGAQQSAKMSYWTDYWGYKTTDIYEFSWGTNTVSDGLNGPTLETNVVVDIYGTTSITFRTFFDSKKYKAQAAGGDSGGAAFYQEDGEWVLGGTISSVKYPTDAPTPVVYSAITHSVALSFYRDQILDIITPEPIPGDANGDRVVDGSDVAILAGNWQVETELGVSSGDFNGDGVVNGSDVAILAGNWQNGVVPPDFSVAMTEASGVDGNTAVPEPSVWLMLFGMISVVFGYRGYRKACPR